jgi:hypothetical protein
MEKENEKDLYPITVITLIFFSGLFIEKNKQGCLHRRRQYKFPGAGAGRAGIGVRTRLELRQRSLEILGAVFFTKSQSGYD